MFLQVIREFNITIGRVIYFGELCVPENRYGSKMSNGEWSELICRIGECVYIYVDTSDARTDDEMVGSQFYVNINCLQV